MGNKSTRKSAADPLTQVPPCPTWCARDAGHDSGPLLSGQVRRFHLGPQWQAGDLLVELEQFEVVTRDRCVERTPARVVVIDPARERAALDAVAPR